MPILTLDQYIAAPKQLVVYSKASVASTANAFTSIFAAAGQPGAGTLAVGNTANGIVPVAGQVGYPALTAFGVESDGHLARVLFRNSVISMVLLYDRLFKAGAYTFNTDTTLASQPAYTARLPGGVFNDLEIWVEQVTAATGNQAVNVFYTNQAGTTGRQTGAVGIGAAPGIARCWQLPLQAGDTGVQRIERVVGSVATAGTFNVMVLRPLWEDSVTVAGLGAVHDMLRTGMIRVWETSALYALIFAPGTATGTPQMRLEIANG